MQHCSGQTASCGCTWLLRDIRVATIGLVVRDTPGSSDEKGRLGFSGEYSRTFQAEAESPCMCCTCCCFLYSTIAAEFLT